MPGLTSLKSGPAGTVPAGPGSPDRARKSAESWPRALPARPATRRPWAGAHGQLEPRALPTLRAQRTLQVLLGAIWLLDGALQLQPFMFSKGFVAQVLEPNAHGQPRILADAITMSAHIFAQHLVAFDAAAAALQIVIGLALLHRRYVRVGLALSLAWGLGVWCFGEGFGGLLTGNASPLTGAPGAAALYVLAALVLWPADRPPGRSVASRGLLGERGARAAWAALWLLLATLWLLPANTSPDAIKQAVAAAPAGAPWLAALVAWGRQAAGARGLTIALALALISVGVAVGVLFGRWAKPLLLIAAFVALAYWIFGQALGGIFTGQATDLNSGPLLILLCAALYPVVQPVLSDARDPEPIGCLPESG